jgi:DnaJ domain
VKLPGRLRSTTLGDLLGALHRARANGTLELVDDRERSHRVHVSAGLVVAVEVDGSAATLADFLRKERAVDEVVLRRSLLRSLASHRLLGEVLVNDFRISPIVVGAALRRQIAVRLQFLEQLADARVTYRVAVRTPRGALTDRPLAPSEFLQGRRRARDRSTDHASKVRIHTFRVDPRRAAALRTLGLPQDEDAIDPGDVKRAYRKLARETHPDLHPAASDEERRRLSVCFAAATAAYQTLVA